MSVSMSDLRSSIITKFLNSTTEVNSDYVGTGSPTFDSVTTLFPNGRSEKFIVLDGSSQYYTFNSSSLNTESGMLSLWLRPDFDPATDSFGGVIIDTPTYDGSVAKAGIMSFERTYAGDDPGSIYFRLYDQDANTRISNSGSNPGTFEKDTPVHITLMWNCKAQLDNSKSFKIYKNGVLLSSYTTQWTSNSTMSETAKLGTSTNFLTSSWEGGIYDFVGFNFSYLKSKGYSDDEIAYSLCNNTYGRTGNFKFMFELDDMTPGLIIAGDKIRIDTGTKTSQRTAIEINAAQVSTFSEFPITPNSMPITDYQVANKKYVDDNSSSSITHNSLIDMPSATNTDHDERYLRQDIWGESGFDLQDSDTLPDLSWDDATRTFSCSVKSGQTEFSFYLKGSKYSKTTTQSVVVPDVTGIYYIYFDDTATIQYVLESNITDDLFYNYAIAGLVYWGKTAQKGRAGAELHGKNMSAATHKYNHNTFGTRYESGLDITGLSSGGTTYTNTTSGVFWDEDIRHEADLQTTHMFMYRLGTDGEWTMSTADNKVSYNAGGSYDVYNNWTGTTWELKEGTWSTDYWIVFHAAIPSLDTGQRQIKILGQNAYSSRSKARAAIESEINNLILNGLPTPEILFKSAWIVKRDGKLQALADGSLYVNLLTEKSSGGASGGVTAHDDLDAINLAQSGQTYGHIDDQSQTIAGVKTFSSFPVTPSSAPTTDYQVANKKYVDDNAGSGGGGDTGYQDILLLGGM